MATQQTFYLDAAAPAGLTLPGGVLAAWGNSTNPTAGANADSLTATQTPGGQAGNNFTGLSLAKNTSITCFQQQFVGPALAAQSISAGSWTFAWAQQVSATSTRVWQPYAALFLVVGTTGAARSTIVTLGGVGASARTGNGELTCYSTAVAGAAFTVTEGDYLALEVGLNLINNGNSTWSTGTLSCYYDGTTAIAADNVATADARSLITAPVALVLSAVQPSQARPASMFLRL